MLNKILILTEGIADIAFLRDYLIFLDFNLKPQTKKIEKELILKSENKLIIIKATGGYTKLLLDKLPIKEHSDDNYKILVIQDADDLTKNHGGIQERMKYLTDIQTKLEIKFECFLFPNNQEDGDLETLLLKIAIEDKYIPTNKCYTDFIQNEKGLTLGFTHELDNNKGMIFNYFRAHNGIIKAKEENRIYLETHWDFKNIYLIDLFNFFDKNI